MPDVPTEEDWALATEMRRLYLDAGGGLVVKSVELGTGAFEQYRRCVDSQGSHLGDSENVRYFKGVPVFRGDFSDPMTIEITHA